MLVELQDSAQTNPFGQHFPHISKLVMNQYTITRLRVGLATWPTCGPIRLVGT